jgi:hormone-sensitive lipase
LEIPVFSVDYRLSPASRFPDALNDCWQVYHWLLTEGPKHLGIKIEEIILAGDSAGGNLITALTCLIIKKEFKKPLGIMMSYPALYVSEKKFVPSLLLSLDDILLPCRFLKHVMAAYSGDVALQNPEMAADKCDLMSPTLADEAILA